ncbi:hypothetical protein CONPUDRAFT_82302 [Coniophora puteana RWD-64-598 SS2]|uniref:Uncharacterized protein n=1 Tax=Coniophora puteana (strain RWD-64-598) TaxID=741705 RepID=A0A5M3MRN8_CONPW|nr:uncharacterized protein CONPUDRAFT_82302 [Coniophora puteana RWD-64-598 SS2]EIW81325.1 hypothetical protein CONPUDRAFT_82302 [Coniophora puteana RWD-64-598 SS2]
MASHPVLDSPWPAATPPPLPNAARSPVDVAEGSSAWKRQAVSESDEVAAARTQCTNSVPNDQWTCFPDDSSVVLQHQYAAVVWNNRLPQLTNFEYLDTVNVYLYNSGETVIASSTSVANPTNTAGVATFLVDDTWFGSRGSSWTPTGGNVSYYYYFVVTGPNGLDGTQHTNPTFQALQTTYADSVISSMEATSTGLQSSISTASVASISSLSVLSTASIASLSSIGSLPPGVSGPSGTGNVQSNNGGSRFPAWAIAVIVVLGFLALLVGGILVWLVSRRMRKRNRSPRSSIGSSTPMMANVDNQHSPQSPLLAAGAGGAAMTQGRASSEQHRAPSVVSPDGASVTSHANSAGDGPFSGADAAIMADAFRKALRKPDFAGHPVEEGESPDAQEDRSEDDIMNRELAEEGRDIRSVGSSRGVRVETLSDAGDTTTEHH